MQSLILSTAVRLLFPLLLLFSLYLLVRGHNEPGGGFVAGLVAAAAFALNALAYGVNRGKQSLGVEPRLLLAYGLMVAVTAGSFSMVTGLPFMTGLWSRLALPVIGTIGTPFLFDSGVCLVVTGMVLMVVFSLMEE